MPCRADSKGTGLGPMTEKDYQEMGNYQIPNEGNKGTSLGGVDPYWSERIQKLEEELCESRDILLNMSAKIANMDSLSEIKARLIEWQDTLEDQFSLHSDHRKEDWDSIHSNLIENIAALEKTLEFRRNVVRGNYIGTDKLNEFDLEESKREDKIIQMKMDLSHLENIGPNTKRWYEFVMNRSLFIEYKSK